jgi:hypothetical protein
MERLAGQMRHVQREDIFYEQETYFRLAASVFVGGLFGYVFSVSGG